MTRKTIILTFSIICATTSTGAYFLGKSASSKPNTSLADANNPGFSRRVNDSNERGHGDSMRSAASRAMREFRESGPTAGLRSIFSISDPLKRSDAFRSFIDTLAPEDFSAFIDEFRKSGFAEENMGDYQMALYAWAQKDPVTALAYFQENKTNPETMQTVLAAWAQYDAAAAEAWALSNFDGTGDNPWLVGVIEGAAANDLDTATRLIQMLPPGLQRNKAVEKMIPALGRLGLEKSIAWLDGLQDEALKKDLTGYIAEEFAKQDPEATIAWAEGIEDEKLRLQTIKDVTGNWIRKNPDAGLTYLRELPIEDQLSMTSDSFVSALSNEHYDKALEWLDSLGEDPRAGNAKLRLGINSLNGENKAKARELVNNLAKSDTLAGENARKTLEAMDSGRPMMMMRNPETGTLEFQFDLPELGELQAQ